MNLGKKYGLKPPRPIIPRSMRDALQDLYRAGVGIPDAGVAIRRRYRAGEFDEDITDAFAHLHKFSREDWGHLAANIRQRTILHPHAESKRGAKAREAARLAAEAAAEEARMAQVEELAGEDPKKRLERLRKEILKRLTIEEQAELMVEQARGDHAQTARQASAQIIEILGLKAANVAEAPGGGPIFALPEGAGPSIR